MTGWSAYIEWNGKDSDRVVVRKRGPAGTWSAPIYINDGNWDHNMTSIAAWPEGAVVLWSRQNDGNFDLFAARIGKDQSAGQVQTVGSGPHSGFHVRPVANADGDVTAAWQSFRDLHWEIYTSRMSGEMWGRTVKVSTSIATD